MEAETSPGETQKQYFMGYFFWLLKVNKVLSTCIGAVTCVIHDVKEFMFRESASVFVIFITSPLWFPHWTCRDQKKAAFMHLISRTYRICLQSWTAQMPSEQKQLCQPQSLYQNKVCVLTEHLLCCLSSICGTRLSWLHLFSLISFLWVFKDL